MIYIIIGVVFWILSGIVNFGATFAYFQRAEYEILNQRDRRSDFVLAFTFGIMGLLAFFPIIFLSEFYRYGFKYY